MRKLQLQDIFKASRLLVSLDLKEEFKEIGLKADKIEDIAAKGFDVFWTIFEKASSKNAENSIYEFLSGIFECTSEEVKTMGPSLLFENLQSIDLEERKVFFKQVAHLMK